MAQSTTSPAGSPPTDVRALLAYNTDDEAVDDWAPKPLPTAWYQGKILRHEFLRAKNERQTPYVRYHFIATGLAPGVEIEAEVPDDVSKKNLRKDLFITPAAMKSLNKFLNGVLGVQQGRSFDDRIADCKGTEVCFKVTARQSPNDEDITFYDVGMVIAAEAWDAEAMAA